MAPPLNLHPERRKRPAETGTSKFFAPSIPQADVEMQDSQTPTETDTKENDEPPREPMCQMRLDFSNGTMGTKKPLRNPLSRDDATRKGLAEVAAETWRLLPGLLQTRPDVETEGRIIQNETLDSMRCPRLPPIKVRVISSDTVDAALDLQSQRAPSHAPKPVAILNMANENTPGGGWRYGALAQEEAICYRTSLILTLRKVNYPIPSTATIYSPQVLVIRDNIEDGHKVVDCRDPRKLEIISVISCAAVCQPSLTTNRKTRQRTYAVNRDRTLMLEKMRVILRTGIRRKHQQLVLGALGCGAFGNPNVEVSAMWKSVLLEPEFSGGYWKDIVFAVLGDTKPGSNYQIFHNELNGLSLS